MENLGEQGEPDDRSDHEDEYYTDIAILDRSKHRCVHPKHDQDERAGYARQDHGADCDGTGAEIGPHCGISDLLDCVLGCSRPEPKEEEDNHADSECAPQVHWVGPLEHVPCYEHGPDNQADEQRCHQDRLVVEEIADGRCEREDSNEDAHSEWDDEAPLNVSKPFSEAGHVGSHETPKGRRASPNRRDEPLVDAKHEGDRAPRDAGNEIGSAHGEAAHERCDGVENHRCECRFPLSEERVLTMRVVVQRVRSGRVEVDESTIGEIERGLVVLVGVEVADTEADAVACASKIASLRIFRDEEGKMNRSVGDVQGGVLVVSQFTLAGNVRKGRRPSFATAARPEVAEPLVEQFCAELESCGLEVQTGVFGAMMEVSLVNDGPVTIIVESRDGKVL